MVLAPSRVVGTTHAPPGPLSNPMTHFVASAILASLLTALVASGLGSASTTFFVVGLLPISVGVAAAVGASVGHLSLGKPPGRGALLAAAVGILIGWLCFQAWDDHHFRAVWAQDLASAREVTTGMPAGADFGEDGVPFFAPDADERLEEQVLEATGTGGSLGRWLLRSQSGVRLIGPWKSSRGLPIGTPGAVVWALLQLLLAGWISHQVLRRIDASDSPGEVQHLDDHAGEDQRAT